MLVIPLSFDVETDYAKLLFTVFIILGCLYDEG